MPAPRPASTAARRGRLVGQAVFAACFVWIVFSGAAQIVAENFFVEHPPVDSTSCRSRIAALRARLAEAQLREPPDSELEALRQFRSALGGEKGRDWDAEVLALVDGCPAAESHAAYTLARLRAAEESLLRLDVHAAAPARRANAAAQRAIDVQ